MMEAIILAGGFGTRLRQVVSDVPKPMAPINKKPFLVYIFNWLNRYNVTHVVLAVGYKKEVIIDYFGKKYKNIDIDYSVEDTPLFTGGAIKKALNNCKEDNVFIINGDTFFDVNLQELLAQHINLSANFTISVKQMNNFDRYGIVKINEDKDVIGFEEKKYHEKGYINGGIYCIKRDLLNKIRKQAFSFEKDYMEKYYLKDLIKAYFSDNYFIDIGIPEDYLKAQSDFKNIFIEDK